MLAGCKLTMPHGGVEYLRTKGNIMSDLDTRISRLERTNRRWQIATVSVAVVMVLAFVMGANQAEVHDLIKTKALAIVDDQGFTRIILRTLNNKNDQSISYGQIGFFTRDGKMELGIAGGNMPELVIYDTKETKRMELSAVDNGAMMQLFDNKGRLRALYVTTEGAKGNLPTETGIELFDDNGRVVWSAP